MHACFAVFLASFAAMTDQLAHQGYARYYHMIADSVRNQAYKQAIFNTVKPGDVVIDLGAGLGLLSVWAVQAGAKKVYAIEKTDAIELAKCIAEENNCSDRIEFIQDLSSNVQVDEQADVLISETLGSFGIDEQTLLFTIDARERLLKNDARFIPQQIDIYVAAISHQQAYEKIDIWRQVPDINMQSAFDVFSSKMLVESVNSDQLICDPVCMGQYKLAEIDDPSFHQQVYMTMNQADTIHGVAGWFTAQLDESTSLSSACDAPATHWKQAVFPFSEPIEVIKNDILEWQMQLDQHPQEADHSQLHYAYRCTQIKKELSALRPGQQQNQQQGECPCGSGLSYAECCMRSDAQS